ncbi:GNAT family N-acetyltransferase [Actinomadura sp. WMMB 499]|uniref:GNAT family N-acetyltransferase n=1 Tax=Actinomadura sp. WMMB 499 TaxID=1219491 RepID=UPI00159DB9B8|nr:GNAT family N-acetyltransferase [Actinomadura sp. WMMB 499]
MLLREFRTDDLELLIDLTVRAFGPIQDGIRRQLGDELFDRQNGQWREDYRRALIELTAPDRLDRFVVADVDGEPAGYAAWTSHPDTAGLRGEVELLAVDPRHQRAGAGRALIDAACDAMRAAGCVVASVATGGDAAHTPARAAYAAAGFTSLPTVFFSRTL